MRRSPRLPITGARIVDAGSKTTPRVSGRLMEVNLGERQVDERNVPHAAASRI